MAFKTAEFRFFGSLVDFLPRRHPVVERTFDVAPSVKDSIEACGVPHPEIDLVLVDGDPVGWDHAVSDGDRISVYPRFHTFDISELSPVHVAALPEPRFVLDVHLTALARYLRLLGFDTLAPPGAEDSELAEISARGPRWLLTRDLGLLKRSIVRHGYFVRSQDPLTQCVEVVRHFDLDDATAPFSRCMECNGPIGQVEAAVVADHIPRRVRAGHDSFRQCAACGRPYWQGTHYGRLEEIVATVRYRAGRR